MSIYFFPYESYPKSKNVQAKLRTENAEPCLLRHSILIYCKNTKSRVHFYLLTRQQAG